MVTTREIQTRQLILREYRSGHNQKQAFGNLHDQLGAGFISASKISYWYRRFEAGDRSVFNKGSYFHDRTALTSQIEHESKGELVAEFKDKRLNELMITWDGRHYMFAGTGFLGRNKQPIILDLFHGMVK
jgi:hypothetical protein